MFLFIFIYLFLINTTLSLLLSNTYIFSAKSNSYVAFDSWHPCLKGYVRFDIRTNTQDGTLAYIDDRGKFDFFYLKLIEGKLRLLFNLGNDRQALNVNMKINDDKWHTILIKRNGQTTILSIDNGLGQNSTITHSEDLYFGGAIYKEYQASPFYFGGIPSVLERPSSGNLSSFDVYMQPRFRGQLRNLVYKNCTDSRLVQPIPIDIPDGVSLVPNPYCSPSICGMGICLINDNTYKCLCDETSYQGPNCQYERQPNELTFNGKQYLKYDLINIILSLSEIITFEFKTNYYDGVLFQLIDSYIYIKLKQGQLLVEYRFNNSWYESTTKNLYLIDNQWHYVQIKRKYGQITILIDQYYLDFEIDIKIDQLFNFTQILIGGNNDLNLEKFHGCLKDISIIFNENLTIDFNRSLINIYEYDLIKNLNCKSLINPIQFLLSSSSSYISFELENFSYNMNISFRFETYSSNCIILYSQSNQDFLGFDLIDGFFFLTLNINKKQQRQELFQQRFNDGQSHYIQLELRTYQIGLELNIIMDYRQNTRVSIPSSSSTINLHTLTIGGVNPAIQWLPTNYFSGIMHRGLIGCFSDLEINNEIINLEKYINYTNNNNNIVPKSGPCSTILSTKRQCLCEHNGECRVNKAGIWSCDCSKTGYTGRRCEQIAYHLDLSQIQTFELNTNIQWSEHISDISFRLQAIHDEEDFLKIRSCSLSSKCDSINFSIRNGYIHIFFYLLNITIDYPFILDNQWHFIYLQRIDTKFLLHIDNHIIQQRLNIINLNISSLSTIRLIFYGNKQIRIEDLRLYDQSIYSKFFLNNQYRQNIQLKYRSWKPLNTISFYDYQNSSIEIQLNEFLCQECQLDTIYFQFRTIESNGLLLFANIQTKNPKSSSLSDNSINKSNQYLILKLINGQLQLTIVEPSLYTTNDEIYQIQTKLYLNNDHWHHIFFHRASDYHLELIIDSNEYYLLKSIYFLDKIYFGRPLNIPYLDRISTIKACFASLTINSHSINLREYIKSNSPIRNDCFLNSQCPLKQCQNTGICRDRIQCDCQHTSFQGKFCTNLKLGYSFNDYTPGLIFDQPFLYEKTFSTYQISFGIVTKMKKAEIIHVNDQISIDLYNGFIRIKLIENEFIQNDQSINDGYYHLVKIQYNNTGYLYLNVDNKLLIKQLKNKILFDKPLLLLIGQNPAFRYPFQGHLYGLESDVYSIFDLISPTFQRISFAPIRNKSLSSSPSSFFSSIIYPSSQIENDLIYSSCSYQPYDDICIITSDTNSSSLSYPDITFQSSLSSSFPIRISFESTSTSLFQNFLTSTLTYQHLTFYTSNTTDLYNISSFIISINTSNVNQLTEKFHWKTILFIIILSLIGIILCIILFICAFIKYRRKDAGVYELEETQRFRPLIVELSQSPGENNQEILNSTTNILKKSNIKSHKKRKRKDSLLLRFDEQREFYI
ncbi:unnamed protein product [Rotaria sordida]|uniref:Uncharacterized protein n=1 Tax=Rotaria sordida TaxID=392033 RepID=A0A815I5I3_9BILA|nr:unnamed protein product [Rotaria sordida]